MTEDLELDLLLHLLDTGGSKSMLQLFNYIYGVNNQYFRLVASVGGPATFVDEFCTLITLNKDNKISISLPFVVCRDGSCNCGAFHVCSHWPRRVGACKMCREDPAKNPDNIAIYKKYPLLDKLNSTLLKKLLKRTKFIIRPETPILFEKCAPDLLRFPQVCQYYNSQTGCLRPCLFFHLCRRFVEGTCKNEAICGLSHDLESSHNSTIVDRCGGIPLDAASLLQVINSQTSVTTLALDMLEHDTMIHNHDTEICVWNLVGSCGKGGECPFHHTNLPFWWQYQTEGGGWDSWDRDNILILEKAYCNPIIRTVEIKINDVIAIIDFPTMTMLEGEYKIRRMSTGPVHGDRHLGSLATAYHWHWEEIDNVWHEFPSCVTQGKHAPQLELPSHVIEMAYLNGNDRLQFKISDSDFVLLFGGMQMKEEECRNIRKICRRPIHRTVPRCAGLVCGNDTPQHEYYTAVSEATSEETHFVKTLLKQEKNPSQIVAMSSNITNAQFAKRDGDGDKKKLYLFHPMVGGNPTALSQHSLLLTDTPADMKKYGSGLHLSTDESYSLHFSPSRAVILCEVIVGEYCRGKPDDTAPPVSEFGEQFHCCVNNVDKPDVYVLYDVMCVKPKFWIIF